MSEHKSKNRSQDSSHRFFSSSICVTGNLHSFFIIQFVFHSTCENKSECKIITLIRSQIMPAHHHVFLTKCVTLDHLDESICRFWDYHCIPIIQISRNYREKVKPCQSKPQCVAWSVFDLSSSLSPSLWVLIPQIFSILKRFPIDQRQKFLIYSFPERI